MQDYGITGEVRVQDSRLKAHLHEHSVPLSCGVNTWLLKASKVIGPTRESKSIQSITCGQ